MNKNTTQKKDLNPSEQGIHPSASEAISIEALNRLYEQYLPKNKNHQVVSAQVTEIAAKEVVLNLGLKADTSLPISQFRDLPDLKVGDHVDVYVAAQEDRHGQLVVSRKDAKKIKAWKMIYDAYLNNKVLTGKVISTSKGGLNLDVQGATAFMPGSQVDITPVDDFEGLLGNTLEFATLKLNPATDNIVISRRQVIDMELAEQKKEIMNTLEEGMIVEGIVSNVTKFGAFVDIGGGGVIGLVYFKHMSWDKRIDHPDRVRDANGEPVYAKGKRVKVVVIGFDKEKTRISLSGRELEPNPWEQLSDEVKQGAEITGVVSKILERNVFVRVENLVEAFMYYKDIRFSSHNIHPSEVLSVGEQVRVKVLTLDRADQEFRVGIKQLKPDPWKRADFYQTYALNSRHQGIVRRLTPDGAYLELEDGVEGYLPVRRMSWTKKIKYPGQMLKKGDKMELLVLSANEEERLLELGLRELEDSPWEKFSTIFSVGSVHQGTLVKMLSKNGFGIVELSYGLETKVDQEHLMKADGTPLAEGDVAEFLILDFVKERQRVLISHSATFNEQLKKEERKGKARAAHKHISDYVPTAHTKTTLGDIGALKDLKKKIEAEKSASAQVDRAKSAAAKTAPKPDKATSSAKSAAAKTAAKPDKSTSSAKSATAKTAAKPDKSTSSAKSATAKTAAKVDKADLSGTKADGNSSKA